MRGRRILASWFAILIGVACAPPDPPAPRERPALAVVVIVDGLGRDVLAREAAALPPGGFRRFLDGGAWWSHAEHGHAGTLTAAGHATLLTGADPAAHGVIANQRWDPTSRRRVYCVEDPTARTLGNDAPGRSPRELLVPTLGDALREATDGSARVFAVSGKDRAAVLSAGRTGVACWYEAATRRFVTSDRSLASYPPWWAATRERPARAAPAAATGDDPATMDDDTFDFVEALVAGERLGRNPAGVPDLLVVALSGLDFVEHDRGPDDPAVGEHLLRIDRRLAALFASLDEKVGPDRLVLALSADHGFAKSPGAAAARGEDAGRIDPAALARALDEHLARTFAVAGLVADFAVPQVWLDRERIREAGLDPAAVERAAATWIAGQPGIARVIRRSELASDADDPLLRRARRSWRPDRGGDLLPVTRPGWCFLGSGSPWASTHGSPHAYDTGVPLALAGPGIAPGRRDEVAETVDLAPTLAALLGVPAPAAATGRVLDVARGP